MRWHDDIESRCQQRFDALVGDPLRRKKLALFLRHQREMKSAFDPGSLVQWISWSFGLPKFCQEDCDRQFYSTIKLASFLDWCVDHSFMDEERAEKIYFSAIQQDSENPMGIWTIFAPEGMKKIWEQALQLYESIKANVNAGLPSFPESYIPMTPLIRTKNAQIILAQHRIWEGNYVVKIYARQRLCTEVELSTVLQNRVRHPSVLTVVDYGVLNGRIYSVSRFGGQALSQYVDGISLSFKKILEIGLAISDVLMKMKELDLVHNDIKPGNILMDESNGHVRLIDFDASRSTNFVPEKGIRYTLAYASPELLHGLPTNSKSDVYSLALTLADLLCNQVIASQWRLDRKRESRQNISRSVREHLTHHCPSGPDSLLNLLVNGVSFDPVDRPEPALFRILLSSIGETTLTSIPCKFKPAQEPAPDNWDEKFDRLLKLARRENCEDISVERMQQLRFLWLEFTAQRLASKVQTESLDEMAQGLIMAEIEVLLFQPKFHGLIYSGLEAEISGNGLAKLFKDSFAAHHLGVKDLLSRENAIFQSLPTLEKPINTCSTPNKTGHFQPVNTSQENFWDDQLNFFRILFAPWSILKRSRLLESIAIENARIYLEKAYKLWLDQCHKTDSELVWFINNRPLCVYYHTGSHPRFIAPWALEILSLSDSNLDLVLLNHERIAALLAVLLSPTQKSPLGSCPPILSVYETLAKTLRQVGLKEHFVQSGHLELSVLLEEVSVNNNLVWHPRDLEAFKAHSLSSIRPLLIQCRETLEDLNFLFDYFLAESRHGVSYLIAGEQRHEVGANLIPPFDHDGYWLVNPSRYLDKKSAAPIPLTPLLTVTSKGILELNESC